jgi:DNA-directed RNA polymerase subunit RPC12/RpoP
MPTITKKITGDKGEIEVTKLIKCPSCSRELMLLPNSYPLYDIQCTACSFRAQVKTNNSKPKKEIFGATWTIVDHILKAGFIVPPLIANFKWTERKKKHQKILFYPFIPRKNLKKRFTTINKSGRSLWMFNYINLHELPAIVLLEK